MQGHANRRPEAGHREYIHVEFLESCNIRQIEFSIHHPTSKLESPQSYLSFQTQSDLRFTYGMLGNSLANNARPEMKHLCPGSHPTPFIECRYLRYVFSVQTPNSTSAPAAASPWLNMAMAGGRRMRWVGAKLEGGLRTNRWWEAALYLYPGTCILGYVAGRLNHDQHVMEIRVFFHFTNIRTVEI